MKAREQLNAKEQNEIERRDFMKMIRETAANARDIVKDGQRQIEEEKKVMQ